MTKTSSCWGAAALFAIPFLLGCRGAAVPSEQRSLPVTFKHTFSFMWEQVRDELSRHWTIDVADDVGRTILTEWDERLAPMNRQGKRHRLRVFIEGADGEGYVVKAEQETEENTNDRNPLSSTDADWEGTTSDGAEADRFLIALARRLNPRMEWKRDMIR